MKARKQVEKNAKLEKEVTELKAQTSRQAKDLENYKLTKKRHKVKSFSGKFKYLNQP